MEKLRIGSSLSKAALEAGIDRKTAKKCSSGYTPVKQPRNYKTRNNPFEEVWPWVKSFLANNEDLEVKNLFSHLMEYHPDKFHEGQLRTFQRKVLEWKCTEGKELEVFFSQLYKPGELAASDYTDMNKLGITIQGLAFPHKVFHMVLCYSKWETGTVCFSESFESLSEGIQAALQSIGGVPKRHRTDSLSAAVKNLDEKKEFTDRYKALLDHYGLEGQKTNPRSPHENGVCEQSHHRFKRALEQALLLRGKRDFRSQKEYSVFLDRLFVQLNKSRRGKLLEELEVMKKLPILMDTRTYIPKVRVSVGSTIRVLNNTYSVPSQLIGKNVSVYLSYSIVDVYVGINKVDSLKRLSGDNGANINYRHVIHSLLRKPGAFPDYKYRAELFPTSLFRRAYDSLLKNYPGTSDKQYLKILALASSEGEFKVNKVISSLLQLSSQINFEVIEHQLGLEQTSPREDSVDVKIPSLSEYDSLMNSGARND